MKCKNCNVDIDESMIFCANCGAKLDLLAGEQTGNREPLFYNLKKLIFKNKKYLILGLIIILLIIIFVLFCVNRMSKLKTLKSFDAKSSIKFKIDDKEYFLGKKVSEYKELELDYKYLDNNLYISSQSIALQTLYVDDEPKFIAMLHCSDKKDCEYKDSSVIKINFYEDSNVLVDEYIKYGMYYEDVVKKYGKEDGVFYQDKNYLVWNLGEKGQLGDAYMILRFDNSYFYSGINDIRIGVWWYEGEYEYTVKEA